MGVFNSGKGRDYEYNFVYNSNVDKLKETQRELEKMASEIERVTALWEDEKLARQQAERETQQLKSGEAFREAAEKAQRFNDLAYQGYKELCSYIRANNLDKVFGQDSGLQEIVRTVEEGERTVGQAISMIKLEFRDLIETERQAVQGAFDTSILQNFLATLERISDTITKVESKIDAMRENGVMVNGVSNGGGLANTMNSIGVASETMSDDMAKAYAPVNNLLGALSNYEGIDAEKIKAISLAFSSIADMGNGSYGTKAMENLVQTMIKLQSVSGDKPISISMNLKGIEDLKVRKTSLSNLAEYLPTIAKVNVNKLKELSNVDFTNFNNIKVSKGAVEEISKIAEAVQILREAKAASVNAGDTGITIDKTVNQALRERAQLDKEVAMASKEWESSQRAAAEQAAQVVTPLQQQINALTGVSSATKDAAESGLILKENTLTEAQASKQAEAALRELEVEERAAAEQAAQVVTPLQQQINALVGIDRETKSARDSWEHMNFEMKEQAKVAKESATADRQRITYLKRATTLLNQMQQAEKNWTKAGAIGSKTGWAYQGIKDAIPQLQGYITQVNNGTMSVEDFIVKVNEMNLSFKAQSTEIRAAGENTQSLSERVGKLSTKFGAWLSITRIIMGTIRTIKQMVKAVVEIDSAMTQLQIVTKATNDDIARFGDTAAKTSKEIGSTITDFTSSVTTFARLGYSLDESSALAKYTAMLQNVGDIDVSEAQDSITSIIKAFGISADQIESVMDKLVITGNRFPISVSQISEGMTNASSTLAAAGNTFEQSVALLTAANTTINLCRVA